MTLSVLTERRVHCPPGLAGGLPGARGKNTLRKMDGRMINLGPKTAVPVHTGVRLVYFYRNSQFSRLPKKRCALIYFKLSLSSHSSIRHFNLFHYFVYSSSQIY